MQNKNSNFMINLKLEVDRMMDIINSPKLVVQHKSGLISIHESITEMLKQYKTVSLKTVREDVVKLSEPLFETYKIKIKEDIKTHVSKNIYKLPCLPKFNHKVDLFAYEIFEELYQNVDLSMDKTKLTSVQKKMIKQYMECKREIISELSSLMNDVTKFEQNMVNYRQKIFEIAQNKVIPSLYESHASFIQNSLKKTDQQITLEFNGKTIVACKKQQEFLRDGLKAWLNLH